MPIRFQVDSDFYDHPKTIGMSDSATALWVRAGSYSASKLSDGFIADDALNLLTRCPDEAASELVRRGLWKRSRGGYRFHEWSPRNLLRARVETDREHDRLRKRGDRPTTPTNGHQQVTAQIVRPDIRPESAPESQRNPPVSVSVSVSESVSGSGHGPEPPTRCPRHIDDNNPPPCGQCAEARRNNDRWHVDRRRRQDTAAKCRQHRGELAHNCRICAAERKATP